MIYVYDQKQKKSLVKWGSQENLKKIMDKIACFLYLPLLHSTLLLLDRFPIQPLLILIPLSPFSAVIKEIHKINLVELTY